MYNVIVWTSFPKILLFNAYLYVGCGLVKSCHFLLLERIMSSITLVVSKICITTILCDFYLSAVFVVIGICYTRCKEIEITDFFFYFLFLVLLIRE